MNLYILVEGRRTEKKVYPQWLLHLVPELRRVDRFDQAVMNNYFLFSGQGYPSLLHNHLRNAVADMHASGRYTHLLLCLDADECSVAERKSQVDEFMQENSIVLRGAEFRVIVQNRCFETWFLGNRRIVPRHPQSTRLREFYQYYNVVELDPELMGCMDRFQTHAQFHTAYLQEIFSDRGLAYSKNSPGPVGTEQYLAQLLRRIEVFPHASGVLSGFRYVLSYYSGGDLREERR